MFTLNSNKCIIFSKGEIMLYKKYRYRCACSQPMPIANVSIAGHTASCIVCKQSWPSNLHEIEDMEARLREACNELNILTYFFCDDHLDAEKSRAFLDRKENRDLFDVDGGIALC